MGEEVIIDFLDTGMKIVQRNDHFNFSIDTVLLASFATINIKTKKVIELGSGNGALLMLMSKRCRAQMYGMEILETSHNLAKKNISMNNLEDKINLIQGDICECEKHFKQQEFDLVVANPPFFKYSEEHTLLKKEEHTSLARHELNASLDDYIKAAYYLLDNRGIFTIVHRADRLPEILELMKKSRIEPKKLQICYTKSGKDAKIVLVEGIKNGVEGLKILPPIYINNDDGSYSEIIKKMYKSEIIKF